MTLDINTIFREFFEREVTPPRRRTLLVAEFIHRLFTEGTLARDGVLLSEVGETNTGIATVRCRLYGVRFNIVISEARDQDSAP